MTAAAPRAQMSGVALNRSIFEAIRFMRQHAPSLPCIGGDPPQPEAAPMSIRVVSNGWSGVTS